MSNVYIHEWDVPPWMREHQIKCPECGNVYVGVYGKACPDQDKHHQEVNHELAAQSNHAG